MKSEINKLLHHMIKAMKPYLRYFYHCTYPQEKPARRYHVIGVDIIFDADLKPWILEINANPSMALYKANPNGGESLSQLDFYIKSQ